MGLGDLTLLLVGDDSLAEQLHVHLEHRGADIERAEADQALDTIRVAVPDLIVLSQDATASDGERVRDALMAAGKPPRMLALCDKKLGAKIATFKHDFVAALEHDMGAELIASCIESLCTLMGKPSSASRPLRSLVADVRRSHMPSKPISAAKQTLAGTAPLVVTPAAVTAPQITAPKPAEVAPADRPTPVVPAPKPATIDAPKPSASALKPLTSIAPLRTSQPTPLSAMLSVPAAASAKVVISVPAPVAAPPPIAVSEPPAVSKPPVAPIAIAITEPPVPSLIEEPSSFDEELDISVASLPPPSLPVAATPSLPAASSPSPTPLFIETQAAPPEPTLLAPSLEPSPIAKARALASRLSRSQRYAAAAVLLLSLAFVTAASVSGDDDEPIATHATASLSNVAQAAQKPAQPAPVVSAPAPVPVSAPEPVALVASAPPSAVDAEPEEPEDSMIDGELYDPHADPARARANYLVNMGHRLRKQGRWGMAEASYLKALTVLPHYARAVSGLVAVHLGRRDGVEALRWAKKLVELQPKRGAHQRLLGDAYALTGNKSSARVAWQAAVRLGDRSARSRL